MRWLACGVTGFLVAASAATGAEAPTFERDVLPILQENCQSCHRPSGANMSGMIAPMSFMSYQEVRPWSKAIAKAVANREMPPWHASAASHGVFKNERTLTDAEVATVTDWAKTGAKRGNPADAPPPRDFENLGWHLAGELGEPDLVLKMPEPYWVADDVQDVQPRIEIPITDEQVPELKWVRAIEYRPGSEVVHHIVGFVSKPGEEGDLDRRSNFGQIASGTDPQAYAEGYGLPLYPGSTVGLSMHYHKEAGPGTGVWDQSEIAVWFHDKPVVHPLESSTISHGGFEIPPKHASWSVIGGRTWDEPFRILELLPHTHLRGAAMKYVAYYPDGSSEVLLDVPKYDYNWQTAYEYAEYKDMPGGTRIEFEIVYDNSPEMAEERNFNSNRAVRFGGPTTDEMDLGWLTWCYQEEGKMPDRAGMSERQREDDIESTD
jgi:mono/diheme cytochrome c family protein